MWQAAMGNTRRVVRHSQSGESQALSLVCSGTEQDQFISPFNPSSLLPWVGTYLEKSYCFDLYGSWKLLLICNSFPMCLKVSKWWNICIYIREDTVMALLWVHPSILLHIAGDHFERKKMSVLPHFLWYLTECITDPNWDHYFQMSTDSGCFIGL